MTTRRPTAPAARAAPLSLPVSPPAPLPAPLPVALLVALLASAVVLVGGPASAQPQEPAAAVAVRAGAPAATWSWPLDASDGAPVVLRPATLPARPWQPGHRGVDLAAAPGQAVLAPVDGVVVAAGRVAGRGVVSIRSTSGWRATLEPVDASVAVGDVVSRGQAVGALSAPGASELLHCGGTSCLHWGVRTGSGAQVVYRDPLSLLRRQVRLLPVPGWATAGVSWPRTASRASR